MKHFRKALIAGGLLLLAGISAVTPAAAATFDGEWNVRIDSSNATCGGGATLSIGINNGRVASSSAINVTLTSGIKRAIGSGHLTATSGSGTWRGAMCSGTWTAQRI